MLKNENKKIWKWADLQIVGVALKSFLSKGKRTHNDLILSDCAESLNQSILLAYKNVCEYLCDVYVKNPSDVDLVYRRTRGEIEKRVKGNNAKYSFVSDLQNRYMKDWGDNIENAFIFNSKERKTKAQKESAEQSKEQIRAAKQMRIERINKRISELIAERESLQKELDSYE